MYERFFQLSSRPFLAAPQPARFVAASAAERARESLQGCLERSCGVALLLGPTGCGKTLLTQVLAEDLRGSATPVALSAAQLTTRRALVQAILHRLGRPFRGMDACELRLTLGDLLTQSDRYPGGVLLVVDDAQLLPLRVFEELRWLTGLQRQAQGAIRLLLAGGPALEETLTQPQLESLAQSIAARAYLEPLQRSETVVYLRRQIEMSGGHADEIFADEVYEAVHAATDGIPRLINQVVDHALVLAYADAERRIDAARIEQAWSELQQMPAVWNAARSAPQAAEAGAPQVIEFGSLDDEPACDLGAEDAFDANQSAAKRIRLFDDDEYQPPAEPEVELSFAATARAESDAFAEEELVIDRYAELDARRLPRAPISPRSDVQELVAALANVRELQDIVAPLRSESRPAASPPEIVIVDDERPTAAVGQPAARKMEYRQLFARLRGF